MKKWFLAFMSIAYTLAGLTIFGRLLGVPEILAKFPDFQSWIFVGGSVVFVAAVVVSYLLFYVIERSLKA